MSAVLACSLCGSGACLRNNADLCRTLNRFRSPQRDGSVKSTPGQTTQPVARPTQRGRTRR